MELVPFKYFADSNATLRCKHGALADVIGFCFLLMVAGVLFLVAMAESSTRQPVNVYHYFAAGSAFFAFIKLWLLVKKMASRPWLISLSPSFLACKAFHEDNDAQVVLQLNRCDIVSARKYREILYSSQTNKRCLRSLTYLELKLSPDCDLSSLVGKFPLTQHSNYDQESLETKTGFDTKYVLLENGQGLGIVWWSKQIYLQPSIKKVLAYLQKEMQVSIEPEHEYKLTLDKDGNYVAC